MSEPTAVYRIHFECGHAASIFGDEYGDGSAWCQTCGKFQVYDRCAVCRSLDCEHPRRDPDASCDDEDDDLGCLMLSPGRGNPGQPRSSSASTCFRGGWVVDSAVRRLITAVQNLPLRDDTQEAETLAAKVRARLPHSYDPVSLDGQAVQALSALVALCDSHGAAYLHTYAAEAAAELERAETEPGYADQSSRTDAAAGSPPTAVEGEVVPGSVSAYAAEAEAELETLRSAEYQHGRADGFELRLAAAEAELARYKELYDLELARARKTEGQAFMAQAKLADYRKALESLPELPGHVSYAILVRSILDARKALHRVTKETQT